MSVAGGSGWFYAWMTLLTAVARRLGRPLAAGEVTIDGEVSGDVRGGYTLHLVLTAGARGETREGGAWPAFEERAADAFRSYFDFLPRGRHVIEYSLRLGNPGRFALPPTRVEAMYAPERFGELPNDALVVEP